ncbi:hypothetical protein, partial [Rhodococcus opacus]|uniref:hypothetical protein n=1 Tax=Rhodococcus opacus TaxID=37919 RepID=UPI002954FF64
MIPNRIICSSIGNKLLNIHTWFRDQVMRLTYTPFAATPVAHNPHTGSGALPVKIGIPREIKNHEYRVAISPAGVHELSERG